MTAEPVQPTEIGADLRHVRSWIFDLDDTLYPPERQILKRVSERIGQYMVRATGLPLDDLAPAEGLRAGLERLNGPRYVFTNGSTRHGERVLAQLGISDLFDGLFAIEDARLTPKPHPDTFARMLARFGLDAATAAFFEDTVRNLEHAKALGMTTVLVGPHAFETEAPFVDHRAAALGPFLATAILPGAPT
jgi:putative hydrolase of the HAD superfamily